MNLVDYTGFIAPYCTMAVSSQLALNVPRYVPWKLIHTHSWYRAERSSAPNETEETQPGGSVVCSYLPSFSKLYLILIIWAKFALDVYVSYVRQFRFLNGVTAVPEELEPFYTAGMLEQAKGELMFKTILRLEHEYHYAVHLSVIYLTNMYCTIWWICTKLTDNALSRAVLFGALRNALNYRPGQLVGHARSALSSISIRQGTCVICRLIKAVLTALLTNIFTVYFMEELMISVTLALVTTPLAVVLFLAVRLYLLYQPTLLEESVAMFVELREDDTTRIKLNQLCNKLGFKVDRIYVSHSRRNNPHGVQIRGTGKNTCLILGWKLVEGHVPPDVGKATYTKDEIAVAVMSAVADCRSALPRHQILLEASRWSTVMIYAMLVTLGFYGNCRLGFVHSPPPYIAYVMSTHLSLPILLIIYTIKNCLLHSRQFRLDGELAAAGMGDHLISYVAKETIANNRCPVEDPVFTLLFSDSPPLDVRIRHIRSVKQRTSNKT